jgi:hypothetical protein
MQVTGGMFAAAFVFGGIFLCIVSTFLYEHLPSSSQIYFRPSVQPLHNVPTPRTFDGLPTSPRAFEQWPTLQLDFGCGGEPSVNIRMMDIAAACMTFKESNLNSPISSTVLPLPGSAGSLPSFSSVPTLSMPLIHIETRVAAFGFRD